MIDGLERNRAQLTAAIAKIVAVDNVHRARMLQADQGLVTVAVGNVCLIAARSEVPSDIKEAFVCVRAEDVLLLKNVETVSASARNRLPGTVESLKHEGPMWRMELDCRFALSALLTHQACEEISSRTE